MKRIKIVGNIHKNAIEKNDLPTDFWAVPPSGRTCSTGSPNTHAPGSEQFFLFFSIIVAIGHGLLKNVGLW